MKKTKDKIIVTAALPYANGPIHIGHLLEYIQADIFTRFLRLLGKDALYICASDMHGTPIEINAEKAGQKPETFARGFWEEHQKDFIAYLVRFDNYYQTHSPENRELAEYFFKVLKKKGHICRKKIKVIYCQNCCRHLPDRFVKGTCPSCTVADQYGDVCENCSSALKGTDLLNPKCVLCGRPPLQKESEHYFFKLSQFALPLKKWIGSPESGLQPEVRHWLEGWLAKGLEDWCISRDGPYFGFEIPEAEKETGEKKYFYVWLDAPIGYISSTQNYCRKKKKKWEDYWQKGQIFHFIGKDISYFHFLFWPALLMAVGFPLPKLTVHGFVTVNGEKMSKSRGTFFTAKDFLKLYPAEALRFYYAGHLDRQVVDVNINFENFKEVNNRVLMGCLGNFCYRVLTFAEKNYGSVKEIAREKELAKKVADLMEIVQESYLKQDFKTAVKEILRIADLGNIYFQRAEPWKGPEKVQAQVGWSVNLARNLSILASPILPDFSTKVQSALGKKGLVWKDLGFKWKGKLKKVEKLVLLIEKVPSAATFPLQMAVGQIKKVEDHPRADHLYLLKVDFGSSLGQKQVVAGLKKYFLPQDLLNRKTIFCLNIKPAKLRGELSEAMILVADDQEKVALLEAEKTKVGEKVKFEGRENSSQEITFEGFKLLLLQVFKGKVFFAGKKLSSPVEDVWVKGVKEGARIY